MSSRVVIAMSGGVDSSVAAALLKEQGYDCIGMHVHFWTDPSTTDPSAKFPQNKCCTLGGLEDARYAAAKLDIPFYVMNAQEEFKENVVDYFLESYSAGRTPNPCIECNRTIKFGKLLERAAELGADFIASGHYARVVDEDGRKALYAANDSAKDQSYFLYHLNQEKLRRILFPIGSFAKKAQVYEVAKKYGLRRIVEKPQSQGLCFFSEASPKHFLKRYLDSKRFESGQIVDRTGRILGTHKGLPLYTIGQRTGLGIGGIKGEDSAQPWYVVRIDPAANRLIVGRQKDILENAIVCDAVEFVSGEPPAEKFEALVRIRHRGEAVPATITMTGRDSASIQCHSPARGVSAGQAAVWYAGDKILGGGIIRAT